MSRSLIVVDAGCDVPNGILQTESVAVLPVRLVLGGEKSLDLRNPLHTAEQLALLDQARPGWCQTEVLSARETLDFLHEQLRTLGPPILALHTSAQRSKMYDYMRRAVSTLRSDPLTEAVASRIGVQDSGASSAGYGVQLIDILEQRQRGLDWAQLQRRAHNNTRNTHTFTVPSKPEFVAAYARSRGIRNVSSAKLLATRLFNIAPILYATQTATRVVSRRFGTVRAREVLFAKLRRVITEERLFSPHVVLSYGGPLNDVDFMPGYQNLVGLAQQRGISVHVATMSMSNAINLGPRALSAGFLAMQEHGNELSSHYY